MANPDAMPGFFDRFSIGHAALGMVFEASRIPAVLAIGSHVAFELVEDDLKKLAPWRSALRGLGDESIPDGEPIFPDTRPESIENHTGDVVAFTAGYYATRFLRGTLRNDFAISAFVAVGAGIWMWSLIRRPGGAVRKVST